MMVNIKRNRLIFLQIAFAFAFTFAGAETFVGSVAPSASVAVASPVAPNPVSAAAASPMAAPLIDSAAVRSPIPSDSSVVSPRIPSGEALESLKEDKDFAYLYAAPEDDSWWAHFWMWLGQQLSQVLQDGEGLDFWGVLLTRVLPWLIVLLALVLVTMKLLGINPDSFLRKKAVSATVPFQEAAGDMTQDDFNERLADALGQRNFRLAIRLYYLDVLQQLSRAGLIEWHPEKTNRQYFREINSGELRERFGHLTRLFEYVWYGETSPGEREFEAARAEFLALKTSIGTNAK